MWIEVKATNGCDPAEPFYISHADLVEASYRRSRYYVYRVTDVDSASPTITRWADPRALTKEGKGRLLSPRHRWRLASAMGQTRRTRRRGVTGPLQPGRRWEAGIPAMNRLIRIEGVVVAWIRLSRAGFWRLVGRR